MDVSSPVNTGSTRSWKKCQACRVQKVKCNPAFRVWPDEKCERCEKHDLPCGPNVSHKESREDSAAHGSGSPDILPEADEFDLLSSNLFSNDNDFRHVMREANPPNQRIHIAGQSTTFEESNTMSPTSSGPCSMGFLNLTHEPSRTQSNATISKTIQRANKLEERLRMLDKMVDIWAYLRSALKSMELTGQNDQILYSAVRMLQINVIGEKIKSIMSQVESLGDKAAGSGDKFQAETAYRRLLDAGDRLGDPSFMCIHPLLTKMSHFYDMNDEPFQAKKILRRLFEETSTLSAGDGSRRLLANSYQKMSSQMAEIFESLSLDKRTFNSKTPCPAFHCALQDQVPEDVLNIMSESGNAQDILLRRNIHVAIEAGQDALIDNIIKLRSRLGLNVDDRDAFHRTPLHLAAQLRRCAAFEALVIAGADRTARDATGRTILEMASRTGSSKMVHTLLNDGINNASADVNVVVSYNTSTPLQAAAEEGHGQIVDILLGHGAKASQVRQYDGKTAAELAWERGHKDIADRINRSIPGDTVNPRLCSFEYIPEMDI